MNQHQQAGRSPLAIWLGVIAALLSFGRCAARLSNRASVGELCSTPEKCWSGACLTHGVTGTCVERCETAADCGHEERCVQAGGGRFCVKPSAGGASCHLDGECLTNRCEGELDSNGFPDLKCVPSCDRPDHACDDGEFCAREGTAARCEPRREPGAPCERDEQCLTLDCANQETSIPDAAPDSRVCVW
jgi:hypothetical protein